MWIVLNDAFLSIVDPGGQGPKGDNLLVRARVKGDLERVFGDKIKVVTLPARDYRFRAFIPRKRVSEIIAAQVAGISYPNFKNSVAENIRHDAYSRIWGVMFGLQNQLNGKTIEAYEDVQAKARRKAGIAHPLFSKDQY